MFRLIVPKVPKAGGVMTELPLAKHPPDASVLASGADFRQFAISVAEFTGVIDVP